MVALQIQKMLCPKSWRELNKCCNGRMKNVGILYSQKHGRFWKIFVMVTWEKRKKREVMF